MPYVGMIYLPTKKSDSPEKAAPGKARYVSGPMPLEQMGPLLRRQVGVDKATQCIALSDGGAGLDHWYGAISQKRIEKFASGLMGNRGSPLILDSEAFPMSPRKRRSRRQAMRLLHVHKPNGVLHPRVQKVGPEHFGIIAVRLREGALQMDADRLLRQDPLTTQRGRPYAR